MATTMFYIEKENSEFLKRTILTKDQFDELTDNNKKNFRQVKKEEILQGLEYLEKTRIKILAKTSSLINDLILSEYIEEFPFLKNDIIKAITAEADANLPF
jgi:hypothetical protein